MIARIRLEDDDEPGVLVLGDDLVWTGTNPLLVKTSNLMLDLEDRSPSRGDWAAAHVEERAGTLGGAIEWEEKRKPPPGTVY